MAQFRRAQGELKSTFDREMANLERETGIKELTATSYQSDSYNYDYSQYDSSYYDGSHDSTVTNSSTTGASAIEGAGLVAGPLQIEAAAGSIANGHMEHAPISNANGHLEPGHPGASHEATVAATEKPVNS
jgi:sec-independent protein translocase protein TatA